MLTDRIGSSSAAIETHLLDHLVPALYPAAPAPDHRRTRWPAAKVAPWFRALARLMIARDAVSFAWWSPAWIYRPWREVIRFAGAFVTLCLLFAASFLVGTGQAGRGLLVAGLIPLTIYGVVVTLASPVRTHHRIAALAEAAVVGMLVGLGAQAQPISGTVYPWPEALAHAALPAAVTAFAWLMVCTLWGRATAGRIILAATGRMPWRMWAFLEDAYQRGVLRRAGVHYQFRHARLQERLAARSV
ncbi:hypothetical protein [Dactylosporangium cerinum]